MRIMDLKIDYISLLFFTMRRGKIYLIGGGAKAEDFEILGPTIINSINTFQFEDWDLPITYNVDRYTNKENIYINNEYKFKVIFPSGWQEKEPSMPNVKISFRKNQDANINIIVKTLIIEEVIKNYKENNPSLKFNNDKEVAEIISDELDYRKLNNRELETQLNLILNELKQKVSNFRLKAKGIRLINGGRFIFFEYYADIFNNDKLFNIIQYQTNYKGNYFLITATYLSDQDIETKNEILNTIDSFTFLDIKDVNKNFYLNTNIEEDINLFNIIRKIIVIIVIIFIIGIFIIVYYKNKRNKKINYQEKQGNEDENPDNDKSNNVVSNHNDFTNKEDNFFDLEKYEEIDENNLTESEKAEIYGKILGLKGKISNKDITKHWKEMIEKYHPDKVSHLGKEFQIFAEKKTKDINKAYNYFKKKYNL